MPLSDYDPVVLEIIERRKGDLDPLTVAPNEVRLNGRALLTAADEPVEVLGVSTAGNDLVRVTLTLIARRVIFDAEQIDDA